MSATRDGLFVLHLGELDADQWAFVVQKLGPFIQEVAKETVRARSLFPGNKQQMAAFSEEHGELANALIDHDRGKKTAHDVFTEAVQSAAMACRVGIDGSEEFTYQWRPTLHMVVKPKHLQDTTAKPIGGDVKPDGGDGRIEANEETPRRIPRHDAPATTHPVQAAQHDDHSFDVVTAPLGDRLPGYTGQE